MLRGRVALASALLLSPLLGACPANDPALGPAPGPRPVVGPPPEVAAAGVLQRACTRCHGTTGAGGFDRVLDTSALIERGLVRPGDPAGSPLYARIADGTMPRAASPLGEADRRAVAAWIAAGAPPLRTVTVHPAFAPGMRATTAPVPQVALGELRAWAVADRTRQPAVARARQRYVRVDPGLGLDADEAGAGLAKLLGSLSWRATPPRPRPVGDNFLFAIDLEEVGWPAAKWDRLGREARLATRNPGGGELAIVDGVRLARKLTSAAGYADALDLPLTRTALEDRLAPAGAPPLRFVVARSFASVGPRALERRTLRGGGTLWTAIELEAIDGRTVGGELLFDLPNGLHGYYVFDADGGRLDAVPARRARDPERNHGFGLGLSCLACHTAGVNASIDPPAEGRRAFDEELRRFAAILRSIGVRGDRPDPLVALVAGR